MRIKPKSPAPLEAWAVEYLPIGLIRERPTNSRLHKRFQIRKIADSVTAFGFVVPIAIDEGNMVLAGHGRLAAAKLLGLETVPTLRITGLTEAQKRAFTIADNKLTDLSAFEPEKLAAEFQFLIEANQVIALEATGFDMVEVDRLLNFDTAGLGNEEVGMPGLDAVAVTRPGDLWLIDKHRVLCGNALDRGSYERLFGDKRAALTFTDPPYNVPIGGHVSGAGRKTHREFAMACGEMSRSEFTYEFLRPAFELIRDFSSPGAIAFACMDWRHLRDAELAAEGVLHEHKNTICWVKSNAGMGSFYRSQHEMVLAFKVSPGPLRNNFGLGGKGRVRSNVWQYPGVNTFRAGRMKDLEDHPDRQAASACERRHPRLLSPERYRVRWLPRFGDHGSGRSRDRTSRLRHRDRSPVCGYLHRPADRWHQDGGPPRERRNLRRNCCGSRRR